MPLTLWMIFLQGNAIIESAGALNDGKRVFITLKMSDAIMAKRGDTINQYIVIANSHDGSLAITALVTNVRVVCNNTLTAAMQGAKDTIKVRHTVSQKDRLQQALRILGVSQDLQEANKDPYSLMSATHISKRICSTTLATWFYLKMKSSPLERARSTQMRSLPESRISYRIW